MSISASIEKLRRALAPVEALRGEHSQLELWLRESFATMEALHGELSDWERDLTRQQAQLDQREAALETERERADDPRRLGTEELREMRRLMERDSAAPLDEDAGDGGASSTERQRSASSRRAAP